ncbi:hypothetical protein ACTXT7_017024 [Hymenolepis weldensis]
MAAFLITNSVVFEIGIGLSLNAILKLAVSQKLKQTEFINQIVGSAFGFGTIIFVPIQAIAIQIERLPDHPKQHKVLIKRAVGCSVLILLILDE